MHVDLLLVPRGPEHSAVARAATRSGSTARVVATPAGAAAARGLGAESGRIVILGLCGALEPGLRVGDAVVCESAAFGARYAFDEAFTHELAQHLGARVVRARTVDRVVTTRAERALLHGGGAAVAEMEGAHLLAALAGRACTVAMLRVVSDAGEYDLPDLSAAIDDEGRLHPLRTALAMLRAPRAAVRFIRDARRGLAALERTAAALLAR